MWRDLHISRMSPAAGTCLCLFLFNILLASSIDAVTYLYYSSPGDSLGHYSGVWGGPIDIGKNSKSGKFADLRQSGFHCAYMYDGGFYTGFSVKGMFLDPISKRVIVHLVESFNSRVSLIEGPICTENPECPSEVSGDVKVYMAHGEATDEIEAEPGPFAMWNSSVYFVVQRWTTNVLDPSERYHRIELRHLTGCEDQYPFTIHRRLDLDMCSSLLATLKEETTKGQNSDTFNTAFHLHVIQKDDDDIAFVTQIYNWTLDGKGMVEKIGITLLNANKQGTVEELFTTNIPKEYAMMRQHLVETGGIDWKDDVICWSSVEAIRCATWDGHGPLKDIQVVLQPGQASTVCYDSDIYLNGENITTGVAIADISDGFYLYFGCRGGKPVEGGAGQLRMHANGGSGSTTEVKELSDKHDRIYAGSMFLTDLCDIRPISTDDKGYESGIDSNSTLNGGGQLPTSRAGLAAPSSSGAIWICMLLTFSLPVYRPSLLGFSL